MFPLNESKRKQKRGETKRQINSTESVECAIQHDHMRVHSSFSMPIHNSQFTNPITMSSDARFNQIEFSFVFPFTLGFSLVSRLYLAQHFHSRHQQMKFISFFKTTLLPRTNLLRREQISLCECNSFNGLAVGTS